MERSWWMECVGDSREETKEKRGDRREKGEGRRMGKTKNEAAKILTTDY